MLLAIFLKKKKKWGVLIGLSGVLKKKKTESIKLEGRRGDVVGDGWKEGGRDGHEPSTWYTCINF